LRDVVIFRSRGLVERVVRIGETSWEEVSHRPWFLAASRRCPVGGSYRCEETDYTMLVWDPGEWRYKPYGEPVWRIEVGQPYEVRRLSSVLESPNCKVSMNNIRYEARVSLDLADSYHTVKVPAPLHYGVDELYQVMVEAWERFQETRIMSFDIEVASSTGGFPRPGDPVFIVSYCVGAPGGDPECGLLVGEDVHGFGDILRHEAPHYLVGFNSSGFDIPYLLAFDPQLREELRPEGLVSPPAPHIDLMVVLDAHGSSFGLPFGARLALDDVAARMGLASREELEVESSVDRTRIYDEWRRNPGRVERYAYTDALLTWRIGVKVLETLTFLYVLTGVSPSVVQYLPSAGSLAEYTVFDIVRRRHGKVYEVRSVRYTSRELDQGWGPYKTHTKEHFPGPTVEEDVAELDYNMLYPTIYYKYRLDPEGVRAGSGFPVPLVPREGDGGEPVWVLVDSSGGPVSEALSYFYAARRVTKRLKKERGLEAVDQAVKILANSAFGMFGKGRGMGVSEVLAGYIFFKSNHILLSTLGFIEQTLRRRVVYTATDAVFVKLDGMDPARLEELVNRAVQAMFGPEFSMKLETVCRRLALLARKTYVCLQPDGGVIVKGMEKLALPRVVKDNLEDIFRAELEGEDGLELLSRLVASAPPEDLFVRSSKRLVDLYDEEEGRFKRANHNVMKAVLARWAMDNGVKPPTLVLHFHRSQLTDYPVVARWLSTGGTLYVLRDWPRVWRCRLADQQIGQEEAVYVLDCVEMEMSRPDAERLAVQQSTPIITYLKRIRAVRNGLDRFLRR